MKLTLRRKISVANATTIEDEIFLEDDLPPMVQYDTPNNEKKSSVR